VGDVGVFMEIHFCSCGGLMEFGKGILKCRSCGKEIKKDVTAKVITHAKKEDVVIIEDNKPDLPTTSKSCPKCKNSRAYWWLIQTRSGDEPPTQFFRCTNDKCKHTWREYK